MIEGIGEALVLILLFSPIWFLLTSVAFLVILRQHIAGKKRLITLIILGAATLYALWVTLMLFGPEPFWMRY